jgi:sugar phosphate isomerase/epimerase
MATMNRREVLGLAASTVVGTAFGKSAFAQVAARGAAPVTVAQTPKVKLDAYSRTLHWLRTPEEVAQACHEVGNTTIDLTVRPYPGHVDPVKVRADLPPFLNGLKRNGITVSMIGMDIYDAKTPNLEAMLDTASSLGIHHTWWRGATFDQSLPWPKQLDAVKPTVAEFSKLLEKYQFKACYHPGGSFPELIDLCRNFDPRYISLHYDTGNFGEFNQGNLAKQIRIGGPYIGGFVWKDFVIDHRTPEELAAAAAARGPAPVGDAARGARGGAPGGRGRGGAGGGSPNGWSSRQVPVGTGVLNLPLIAQALKDINFVGPMECQPEWPELGGPNQGSDKLTIPRAEVMRMLKRDFDTVMAAMKTADLV